MLLPPGDDPDDVAGALVARLAALGCTGAQEVSGRTPRLRLHVAAGSDLDAVRAAVADGWAGARVAADRPIEDPGWVERFHRSLRPLDVGRSFTIVSGAGSAGPGRLEIRVEAGLAFGTGHHASTRLALRALEEAPLAGARAWDVGTGSGILAAAALRLGAATVLATELDPDALRVAARTLGRLSEPGRGVLVLARGACGVRGPFDVIVANMIAAEIEPLLDELVDRLRPDGRLILSGLLADDEPGLRERLERRGLRARGRREAGWIALEAGRDR